MGKQEEIRCLDVEGWWSRQSFGCAYNYSSDWECLVRLNQLIVDADRLLYGHNEIYPMYYESKEKKIEELGDNFTIYLKYVDNLPNDIKAIDHAFYVDITSNAVQDLSEIKQEKYSVQEGVLAEKYGGVTLEDYVVGCRVYDYQNLGETTIELTELQEFSEMLQSTFHEQAQADDMETEKYILQMLENGEYDHQAYHPGEDFFSGLLDTVTFGVKPMLEMIAGEDFVTGEEMTDTLRKEKSIEVIMGMVAVAGIPLTKIGSQGAKGFVTQLGIEMATGAVGYTIYETGEAIDLPPGLTMVATLAGGALTYRFLEGRILRVGVAEGVSASALNSLDDGLKSVDDFVERPIEGGSDVPKAFRQETFNSSYEERIVQTPGENNKLVEFKNNELRGESKCTLKPPPDAELQKILDEAGIDGIEYRNAVPDFSPVSKIELEGIDMTNGRTGAKGTYTQANNRVAEMLNNSPELVAEFGISPKNGKKFTASDVSKYMADNKLTWHELNDLTTVQMVPTKVNSTFGHLGGISEASK